MATIAGEVPVPANRPLRERLVAVFKFSKWFPERSSRRSEKKRASRTKEEGIGAQKKARSTTTNQCSRKKVKEEARQQKTQEQQHITGLAPPLATRPKIANYEPPKPYTSLRVGSVSNASSRKYPAPGPTGSRHYSGTRSVPVSGELSQGGTSGPKIIRSSSRSLSKLRDQYVRAMLKLGDMADSVSMGTSVNLESKLFESEVIRKRSQADSEIMDFYLNSSIQPDEWKDARMGSRVIRNGAISV